MTARVLLVYALCLRPRQRIALAGIRGEPLEVFAAGALAALAGTVARPPQPSEAALRRYDAVLRALAQELPALLPARFGTCMESSEELAFVLRAREAPLRLALQQVRGRVQMTLRGVDARPPPQDRSVQPAGGHRSGAAYLHALAAAASRRQEVPALAPVIAAVHRWVRAQRVERRGAVASVYHLIPRGSVQPYMRAARQAAQEGGVPIVLTGPFPAYAFGGW